MFEPVCECGMEWDPSRKVRFCSACGHPLLRTPDELTADVLRDLRTVFERVCDAARNLRPDARLADDGSGTAWTRIDARGFAVVAWYFEDVVNGGVHGCNIFPLRDRGYALQSTSAVTRDRWYVAESIDDVSGLLPEVMRLSD